MKRGKGEPERLSGQGIAGGNHEVMEMDFRQMAPGQLDPRLKMTLLEKTPKVARTIAGLSPDYSLTPFHQKRTKLWVNPFTSPYQSMCVTFCCNGVSPLYTPPLTTAPFPRTIALLKWHEH